jgi:hypothetical protein
MRRVAALVLIATAACYSTRQWAPVEVDWTFGGQTCADAGVDTIRIDVNGENLTQNQFTCAEAGKGVDLGQFLTGPYTMTVTGLDSVGNVIFQTTTVVHVVNGSNVIVIDAAPTTGSATLRWSFAGQTCDGAGVATVRISVDGQVITDLNNNPDLPCKGTSFEGTTIAPLEPGGHTFSLAAHGASHDYAADNVSVTVAVGQDTNVPIDLAAAAPTTASADVRFSFQPGNLNCAQIGADQVFVVFDPAPNGSGGTVVASLNCIGVGGVPVTESEIVNVPDGNHLFAIRATRQNQIIAYTHHPVQTLFSAPFTTTVDVTAEPLP